MITKLEQLTMGQFVDLVCGNTDILCNDDEHHPDSDIASAMRNIVFEYKEIADPSGARNYLSSIEELVKAKLSVSILSICQNLIDFGEYDRAKEVLEASGTNAGAMSKPRLKAEIKSRLERAKRAVSDNAQGDSSAKMDFTDIRRTFDEQTAALMAYFKFQIDTSTMRASVYAHLVARFNREIRALKKSAK